MSLIEAFDELSKYERQQYESMKAERPDLFKILGWLVRQQGGRVKIPKTVLVQHDFEFMMSNSVIDDYIILESRR